MGVRPLKKSISILFKRYENTEQNSNPDVLNNMRNQMYITRDNKWLETL